MSNPAQTIPGCAYGEDNIPKLLITLQELEQLKTSVGFSTEANRFREALSCLPKKGVRTVEDEIIYLSHFGGTALIKISKWDGRVYLSK